jgi:hypothetical protein
MFVFDIIDDLWPYYHPALVWGLTVWLPVIAIIVSWERENHISKS